jgi:hypothetical protein
MTSLVCAGIVLALAGGCHSPRSAKMNKPTSPNKARLDELDAAHAWFHAKKTRPIWARLLDHDQTVETLEGKVTAKAGDYLCRGEAGELWPQSAKTLGARYAPTDTVPMAGGNTTRIKMRKASWRRRCRVRLSWWPRGESSVASRAISF